MSNRVCLFSSYFSTSMVPKYVKYYINQLRSHFDTIIFVTNEDKVLDDLEVAWLQQNTDRLLFVKNEGLDFGMWKKALAFVDLNRIDELCLANDSCLCFKPLDEVIHRARLMNSEAVGLVKAYQIREHLQSYFLLLRGKALPVFFQHIQETDFFSLDYTGVVIFGEIVLSAKLEQSNIALEALFSPTTSKEINPSFDEIYPMLKAGIPLIKRKLLIASPSKHTILYSLQHNYESNPNRLIDFIKEQVTDEVGLFMDEYRQSFRTLWKYHKQHTRLFLKHKILCVFRSFGT